MNKYLLRGAGRLCLALALSAVGLRPAWAAEETPPGAAAPASGGERRPAFEGLPGAGPGGFGPGGQRELKIRKRFDADGNKRLDAAERRAAREYLATERPPGRVGRRGGGRGGDTAAPAPGPRVNPAQVRTFPDAPLYDPEVLRTVFLDFEAADWEQELEAFNNTDVDVPARLTVDGRVLEDVGVHFRGASSYFMVGTGRKRSLNISLDEVHDGQALYGYHTLNLLNSHTDPTFLRTALYHHIAREYLPAPKANHVKLVINGESWGLYVNVQQFDKVFLREWTGSTKGARWKVPGSPRGRGGLEYLGDDPTDYRPIYELKTKDEPKAWADLIQLCKVLNQTAPAGLEAALKPLLDVDQALRFLALENVFINGDGYWVRASDYDLFQDQEGRFHIIPYDANETFRAPGGPGFGGGGRVNGVELDPLTGADDPSRALLHRLLAVPELRTRYLGYVRQIAEKWLDWRVLGPLAEPWQSRLAAEVAQDTRKLDSTEAFAKGLTESTEAAAGRNPRSGLSLKHFADQRRAYLLQALPNQR